MVSLNIVFSFRLLNPHPPHHQILPSSSGFLQRRRHTEKFFCVQPRKLVQETKTQPSDGRIGNDVASWLEYCSSHSIVDESESSSYINGTSTFLLFVLTCSSLTTGPLLPFSFSAISALQRTKHAYVQGLQLMGTMQRKVPNHKAYTCYVYARTGSIWSQKDQKNSQYVGLVGSIRFFRLHNVINIARYKLQLVSISISYGAISPHVSSAIGGLTPHLIFLKKSN